jgi:hypothetical protein
MMNQFSSVLQILHQKSQLIFRKHLVEKAQSKKLTLRITKSNKDEFRTI